LWVVWLRLVALMLMRLLLAITLRGVLGVALRLVVRRAAVGIIRS
jgi:hypothetical protein